MEAVLPVRPASYRAALGLMLFALALTGLWLGVNLMLPQLQSTGIGLISLRLAIHGSILFGLWLGLARTDFAASTRKTMWLTGAMAFTAWLAVVWGLAVADAFRPRPGLPALPIAIFLPLLIGLPLLLRSERVGALLDATPAAWLVGVQVYRLFGGIFLVAWSRGDVSGIFALPAGTGDVLVGVLALPVAYLLNAGAAAAGRLARLWNVLGLVDFAIAVAIGMLTAPGPLQLIIPDRPNAELVSFPMVMIPAFAVPSSILLHGLSLRQLQRLAKRVAKA